MWKLAWRHLWRNRTRTIIITSAIALTLWLTLAQLGISDALHAKMEVAAVKTAGGSVLIHADGYWELQTSDMVIRDPSQIIAQGQKLPGVEAVVQRVYISGLLTSPRGSAGVRLVGIYPDAEKRLQDMSPFVSAGEWLQQPTSSPNNAPTPAKGFAKKPIVLGSGVVEALEIKLGDRVVLTATQPSGEVTRVLFHLSGILHTGTQAVDDSAAYTGLEEAREVLGEASALTQVALVLSDDKQRDQTRDALQNALGPEAAKGLELLTWSEAMPDMVGFIEIDDAFMYIYTVIIFVIVAFGIANTFLMSVMERVRELGLLSALGLTPRRIFTLVLSETVLLSALSVSVGVGLALLSHSYLASTGVDLKDLYDMDMDVGGVTLTDTLIQSTIYWDRWAFACGFVVFMVTISGLYPAWRASRQDPAEAMRTYE